MPLSAPPPTDELLKEASSATGVRCLIERRGEVIALFLQSDRILAYKGDDSTPFGILRFGGPHSGAIWLNGDLIGEYDKNLEGDFIVVEIEDGFMDFETRRTEDPIAFLIGRVTA